MLKLYDLSGKNNLRFSPPCWNIKLCLIQNNIEFITIPVRFTDKDKIAFSKQKLVPILDHKDGFVCDSWNIINWLNENYPKKKIFINNSSKNFSYFLYLWTSRQLLPILFKIIAHEIPNVLNLNAQTLSQLGRPLQHFSALLLHLMSTSYLAAHECEI